MKIETTIYVEPIPKGRPKTAVRGGRVFVYTPPKTAHAEAMIRQELLGLGAFGEGIPLRLEATFYLPRPKTLPKRVRLPMKKPDLSNLLKTLEDAMEKFVYQNDSQLVDVSVKKRFGSPPRIELAVSSEGFEEGG